jgi:hypothetical protein
MINTHPFISFHNKLMYALTIFRNNTPCQLRRQPLNVRIFDHFCLSAWQKVSVISAKARSAFQGYLPNMVLKDILPDFQEFLRNRRIVPERNIPYYALWVRKFLGFANRKNAGESEHVVQEFVAGLRAEVSLDTRTLRRP